MDRSDREGDDAHVAAWSVQVHRPGHEQIKDFQRPGFARAGLGAEERQPGRGVEGIQHVSVRGPQHGSDICVLGGQDAEPADECPHVVQGGANRDACATAHR